MSYVVAYPYPFIAPDACLRLLEVSPNISGADLRHRIVAEYPGHSDDLKDAVLWKASNLAVEDVSAGSRRQIYDWIKDKGKNPCDVIEHRQAVGNYFPDGPQQPTGQWVDIVVVTPEIFEVIDYQGSDGNLRLMKERLETSRTLWGSTSPSDSVESPAVIRTIVTGGGGPRYGRPSHRFGPPTTLFNQALALLKYDLDHLENLTPFPESMTPTFEFITTATDFFEQSGERGRNLQSILEYLIGANVRWQYPIEDQTTKPYGVWLEGPFSYLIFEQRGEPGLGGDPFLRGLAMYTKIIQQNEYSNFISRSNLPAVLLSMAGNCLVVSTAIYTDAVYADKLFSIDLHLGPLGPDNVLRAARVFMAINKCANQLRLLYRGLDDLPKILPRVMYPNPTADPPEAGVPHLDFICKVNRVDGTPLVTIDEENKRHAIYLANMRFGTIADGSPTVVVLVKFAAKYNKEAHLLLAKNDPPLAPALYFCDRVIGGLHMVVMEYMSEASPLRRFFLPSPLPYPIDAKVVRRSLAKAIKLLHGQGYVFGDLRPLNILYSWEGDRVFLVDFDGVGRHEEDRYSPTLNYDLGLGVGRWEIMKKEHDFANLERVMEWLSERLSLSSKPWNL